MTGGQMFVLGMFLIMMLGGALSSWARAAHGQPLADGQSRWHQRWHERRARRAERLNGLAFRGHAFGGHGFAEAGLEAERKVQQLSAENDRLTGQVSRLEARIAVLERIATDPAERVSREIEALR
jgi:hypothetical protein